MGNKNTVQNAVYQELKKGIMTLRLVPGTEMSTQEIATKLQVSRTPVREAFIQLQKKDWWKQSRKKEQRFHQSISNASDKNDS